MIRCLFSFPRYHKYIVNLFERNMSKNPGLGGKRKRAGTAWRKILTREVLDVPVVCEVSTCSISPHYNILIRKTRNTHVYSNNNIQDINSTISTALTV